MDTKTREHLSHIVSDPGDRLTPKAGDRQDHGPSTLAKGENDD